MSTEATHHADNLIGPIYDRIAVIEVDNTGTVITDLATPEQLGANSPVDSPDRGQYLTLISEESFFYAFATADEATSNDLDPTADEFGDGRCFLAPGMTEIHRRCPGPGRTVLMLLGSSGATQRVRVYVSSTSANQHLVSESMGTLAAP